MNLEGTNSMQKPSKDQGKYVGEFIFLGQDGILEQRQTCVGL